jgi:hypothetical protein
LSTPSHAAARRTVAARSTSAVPAARTTIGVVANHAAAHTATAGENSRAASANVAATPSMAMANALSLLTDGP